MQRRALHILTAIVLLCIPASTTRAQDGLPTLEIENVTVIGKRMVVLPKARKGEVLDTSLYYLPPGDSMLLGERISNLGGTGGPLPGYREFELPLKVNGEASLGSYLSPRAMVRGEYIRKDFDVAGAIDYRSTAGHIDSAEASSFMIGGWGSMVIGDEVPPLKSFRLSLGLDHAGDGYFLYGNSLAPFDRGRSATRFNLGLRSEEEVPVQYALGVEVASTGVEDRLVDSVNEATAVAPAFTFDLTAGIDTALRGGLHLDFTTTSLRYLTPAQTPSYVSARGELEWRPSPGLTLTGGLVFATGENSDSGSASLLMPRASLRYELNSAVSLFGWFAPEMRAATYRERIMKAPYVDREIELRPERVPVRLAAGARLSFDNVSIEGRGIFESAENTPVVVAEGGAGVLRYRHVDSRTVGAEASMQMQLMPALTLAADAAIRSAVVTGTGTGADQDLPMVPALDLRARADFALNPEIDIFGSLLFQSEQRTVLADTVLANDARTIPARFLLGAGASYRVLPAVQVFAEVSNLLNYRYDLWQNYSAPGFEIRGGVRVAF